MHSVAIASRQAFGHFKCIISLARIFTDSLKRVARETRLRAHGLAGVRVQIL